MEKIDLKKDRRHNIPVILDYRLAHTIINGLRGWLDELEKVMDDAVRKAGSEIPCRRTKGEMRK
ncbi:MAG TPA: hypothetical protein ENL19_01830 [candidate division WOR-3 bacterium]|uniref:Uncharacterized protein n=1 Tax=candidate division WOR-3 bacterium TaxID=2052148 RepID=A0A7C5DAW5_UNCW3|nr:hypothetical protein [candidate division WOR-3 bacterium]